MKIALDTNILVYAEGLNGRPKRDLILSLLSKLPDDSAVIPVQVLGELYSVLTRKGGMARAKARSALLSWADSFPSMDTSEQALLFALDLCVDHQLGMWDAIVVSVAAIAGCRILLSEDLQDGFTWHGITIVNPFADPQNELLAGMLSQE